MKLLFFTVLFCFIAGTTTTFAQTESYSDMQTLVHNAHQNIWEEKGVMCAENTAYYPVPVLWKLFPSCKKALFKSSTGKIYELCITNDRRSSAAKNAILIADIGTGITYCIQIKDADQFFWDYSTVQRVPVGSDSYTEIVNLLKELSS